MSSPDRLLTVSRGMLPFEHQQLRHHIPRINRLGDFGIKWRKLGESRLTLVERGVFQRALNKSGGLAVVGTVEIARQIMQTVVPTLEHGRNRLTVPVYNVDYYGEGRNLSIAYTLEGGVLDEEVVKLTGWLDRRNGVNSDWGEFDPHVTVATIPAGQADNDILDAFWSIHPDSITLLPINADAT